MNTNLLQDIQASRIQAVGENRQDRRFARNHPQASGCPRWIRLIFGWLGLAAILAGGLKAQDSATYFRQNCTSCHTIGGGTLTGPDLKDLSKRRERGWSIKFIQNPQAAIDSGDPVVLKMAQDARGVVMPKVGGMNAEWATAMVELIDAESLLEKSQFKGMQLSERPFTAEDVARGERLFRGTEGMKAGGPSCLSCHTVNGVGQLGGGRLGPDLSLAFERLGGRKGLSVWLSAPATPTMQAVFADRPIDADEILPLAAYLQSTTQQGGEDTAPSQLAFALFGVAGAGVVLVLFEIFWSRRFRSVRRKLVQRVHAGAAK